MDPNLADSSFNFANLPLPQANAPKGAPFSFRQVETRSEEVGRLALNVFENYPHQASFNQPLPASGEINAPGHKFTKGDVFSFPTDYLPLEGEYTQPIEPLHEDTSNHNKPKKRSKYKTEGQELDVSGDALVADENTLPDNRKNASTFQSSPFRDHPIILQSLKKFRTLAKDIGTENIDEAYSLLEKEASKLIQKAIEEKKMFEIFLGNNVKVFASPAGKLFIELCVLGEGAYKKASKILKVAFSSLGQAQKSFGSVKAIVIEKELSAEAKAKLGVTSEEIENERKINQALFELYKADSKSLTRVAVYRAITMASGKKEKKIGFMSPFANGGDMDQWIMTGGNKTLANKVKIASDMAVALSELHAKGIVHRDIKPDNFLVFEEEDGTLKCVKICDFGKASFVDPEKRIKVTVNLQMAYTPPEWTLTGSVPTTLSGDVFQLGITLYQIFAEKRTQELHFSMKVLDKILNKATTEKDDLLENLDSSLLLKAEELFAKSLTIRKVSLELRDKVGNWPGMNEIHEHVRTMILRMVSPDPALRPPIGEVVTFFKNLNL